MDDQEISGYLFLEDKDQSGDVAIVFGVRDWKEPVKKARELHREHKVPLLLFTGGINRHSGANEAQSMAREALKEGIPSEAILIEDKATNTLENVLLAKQLLDSRIGLHNIHTICAVTIDFHARRALMTLKKYLPAHIQLKACPYSYFRFGFDKHTWQQSELGKKRIHEEVQKIEKYLRKGDIVEI